MGYRHLVKQSLENLPGEWEIKKENDSIIHVYGIVDDVSISIYATDDTMRLHMLGFPLIVYVKGDEVIRPVSLVYDDFPPPLETKKFLRWFIEKAIEVYDGFSSIDFQELNRSIASMVAEGRDVAMVGTHIVKNGNIVHDISASLGSISEVRKKIASV